MKLVEAVKKSAPLYDNSINNVSEQGDTKTKVITYPVEWEDLILTKVRSKRPFKTIQSYILEAIQNQLINDKLL